VRCERCHGTGVHATSIDGRWACVHCEDCQGSGIAYCCEHYDDVLTHGVTMKESIFRIDYRDYDVNPDQTGWYVFEYRTEDDLQNSLPCDVVGPFTTRAAAARSVLEASDRKDMRKREYRNERAPSLPTQASKAGDVHVELQQTQELRDVPTPIQSD
jgi:hypothetical protein